MMILLLSLEELFVRNFKPVSPSMLPNNNSLLDIISIIIIIIIMFNSYIAHITKLSKPSY